MDWSVVFPACRENCLTPPTKESLQELGALRAEYSFDDFHPVIQNVGIRESKLAAHAPEPQISRSKDQTCDASID